MLLPAAPPPTRRGDGGGRQARRGATRPRSSASCASCWRCRTSRRARSTSARTRTCWCGCSGNAASPRASWRRRARRSPSTASGASPGAKRTLLFYAHFDGQPVAPESAWKSPPFEPVLRTGRAEDGAPVIPWAEAKFPLPDEARIYARSSSDDKGPIVAMLAALDALDAAKIPLSANLKFFLEGEEEAGSPNLARTLATHRELLGVGPVDLRRRPDRPARPAAPVAGRARRDGLPPDRVRAGDEPALRPLRQRRAESRRAPRRAHRLDARARMAASRSTGWRRRRRPPATLELARTAFDTPGMLASAGIGATESGLDYGESVLRPSLNLTQLLYGGAGGQRNAIDAEATAGFDLRLVPGMTVAGVARGDRGACEEAGLRAASMRRRRRKSESGIRGSRGSSSAPTGTRPRCRTPAIPAVARVIEVMRAATGDEVRVAPLMGGSLPIASDRRSARTRPSSSRRSSTPTTTSTRRTRTCA